MRPLVMGVTGASGAVYARRLAQCLVEREIELHLIVSPAAQRIIAEELGIRAFSPEAFLGQPAATRITLHPHHEIGAVIASGSFLTDGMVICPCSSRSLGAIANGLGDNLITRAALVTLKEARRLVLVPREMPLSRIELENMLKLSQAGAVICPASPGFYTKPSSLGDLVDFVAGRVLDLFELPHDLNTRWKPRGETE
jgi:4-hydroxy-3-polyprenylbenzoate decarboxylase